MFGFVTSFSVADVVGHLVELVDSRGSVQAVESAETRTFSKCFAVPTTVGLDRSYNGNSERWDYDLYIPGNVTEDMYSFYITGVAGFASDEQVKMWVSEQGRHFVSPTGRLDYTIYGLTLKKG